LGAGRVLIVLIHVGQIGAGGHVDQVLLDGAVDAAIVVGHDLGVGDLAHLVVVAAADGDVLGGIARVGDGVGAGTGLVGRQGDGGAARAGDEAGGVTHGRLDGLERIDATG